MRKPTLILLLLAACIPDYKDADVKLVGVGYNPDEIGPSPTPYGGVVEYSLINFSGAGLSLAMMQLGSLGEISEANFGSKAPYRAVYGFSYMFDSQLTAADSLGGVTSVPPDVEETCYTTFEATGPIGSFTTVDVGSYLQFRTSDGNGLFQVGRLPGDYPENAQDAFIYYFGFDWWQSAPYPVDDGSEDYRPLRPANFPLGQAVEFGFPGGMAPQYAPVSSLPQPSSAVGNTVFTLPQDLGPVMLEWEGVRIDAKGQEDPAFPAGTQRTCLSYAGPAQAPETAEACEGSGEGLGAGDPQMYTGPWDTEGEKVTFRWTPGTQNPNEIVSLAVRFLGPVDRKDAGVLVRDAKTPCEDGEWVFDRSYQEDPSDLSDNAPLNAALRGDPAHNLAEVTCRLKDDGEYTLSMNTVQEAYTYAQRYGAEGAVFYLARSTEADVEIPPVMNAYEQKLEVSPIKLTSRVIDIGRFWYEEGQ
jgi:hypothetical protein